VVVVVVVVGVVELEGAAVEVGRGILGEEAGVGEEVREFTAAGAVGLALEFMVVAVAAAAAGGLVQAPVVSGLTGDEVAVGEATFTADRLAESARDARRIRLAVDTIRFGRRSLTVPSQNPIPALAVGSAARVCRT
jgi:hypothetical protein